MCVCVCMFVYTITRLQTQRHKRNAKYLNKSLQKINTEKPHQKESFDSPTWHIVFIFINISLEHRVLQLKRINAEAWVKKTRPRMSQIIFVQLS